MKVDLVMWAKDGSKTLPIVLKRIEEVIPNENVNQKIFVDDHSVDNSVKIAKSFKWKVYPNEQSGIPSGANTALKHVSSPFFISVEQDLILAKDWWEKIPPYMENKNIAVAQGIHLPTHPTLRKLEEYALERRDLFVPMLSIDNNIYRTETIRKLGGFPLECPVRVDAALRNKGFKLWIPMDNR